MAALLARSPLFRLFLQVAFTVSSAAPVTFATLGDWGGASIGGPDGDYHGRNEVAVAKTLGEKAAELAISFVINTGDNFYYCGVQNLTDDRFKEAFEDIFTAKSLSVPWYGVLGNHDYAYDVQAQLKYKSPVNDRWQIPAPYYTKRILLGGSQYATFVFVDTNPCIASYRGDDPAGWDPCSGQYGECKDNPDDTCHFNAHIVAEDCSKQYQWLQSTMDAIDQNDWVIAVGHHEADKIDVEDLTRLLLKRARLYLNGHTHALKHYTFNGYDGVDFVTSGAGSMVHTHDQEQDLSNFASTPRKAAEYSVNEVFYKKVSGFAVHTFSSDFATLKTEIIDVDGASIHSFVTTKTASAISAQVVV
eukprot:TRINITY_DN47341_c0_g1_i1.p1 TRINITY_DN47341_c0_g1~~TRINITY_DN47341_c0_g1_i1.p1  ORF type:complete len:360 (-),score=59.49 TRINITY_DN47341_c0_g1_i1:335-1414(-)